MATHLTLADLRTTTNLDLPPTGWLQVSQDRVNAFGAATNDEQWIHVDPERARTGPFGGTIVHGYLTLSLLPHFVQQSIVIDDAGLLVNYGIDKLRFPAPVPVGSNLRLKIRLLEAQEKLGGMLFRLATEMEVEG
ncbi:MAG: MaoC family dehydratase, partial [Vicinamibacteraceae bacterium]|nr:MaoC family dehydratase [Vicinamibacteraceae bacterium]